MTKNTSMQGKKKPPLPVIIGGVVLVGGVVAFFIFHNGDDDGGSPAPKNEIKMISLPPPPPPPPPPPKQQEPPKPDEPKFQKEEAPTDEKPPDKAPEPQLSTSIQGNDASGLGSGNGGGGFGGGGGGRGSKFGYYAGQVKNRIVDALRTNKKTRSAVMDVQVRVWLDTNGKITKVSLAKSTGDSALDAAIKSEVLADVSLKEPPPQGMPMPIVMHFRAKRPN
jgi:hypothetical protein